MSQQRGVARELGPYRRRYLDWGLQATKYIVVGSYDDTCDAIFWGIADVSASTTECHKNAATVGDPYVYYNIVKAKLLGE